MKPIHYELATLIFSPRSEITESHEMNFARVNTILILLLVLLSGCSKTESPEIPEQYHDLSNLKAFPADVEPRAQIQFIADQTFGISDEVVLGNLGPIEIDRAGKVYIADMDQNTIHVFLPDGSYLTNMGREGFGPGEFKYIASMQINANSLYVHEWYQKRIHVFSLKSNQFERTIMLNHASNRSNDLQSNTLNSFFVRSDGSMLMSFSSPRDQNLIETNAFYFVDSEGVIKSERIFAEKDVRYRYQLPVLGMVVVLPFYRKSLITMSNDGYIFKAWSEDLMIKVHDPSGNYKYSFYYPYNNIELKFDDIARSYEDPRALNAIRNAVYEEVTWPSLNDLIVDDEKNIWISTIVEDMQIYNWWILDKTGEFITRFEWRRDEPIEVVKNGYMYTRETDEERGLQQVVKYRFEFGESL